ncbi:MAG: double-stranded uracil-DNA glycosylase [Actinomycetota bacterium]|jgi:TDG/mug DNA glycosylase family protein
MALAERHWTSSPGEVLTLDLDVPPEWIEPLCTGAGFAVERVTRRGVRARRLLSLPDTVGPSMRLLVCGLNPSVYSAERGVGYARPGNRFWPAALRAGIVTRELDGRHALLVDGVGVTDLVKRATVAASELTRDEYRAGVDRLTRLVTWLRPAAVCFVGLAGWRAAVDRTALPGPVAAGFAGVPACVMPSTSGLNARTSLDDLAAHLRAAAALSRK